MAGLRATLLALLAVAVLAGCGGHKAAPPAVEHFHSRPDLTPPVVSVAVAKPAAAPGYLFIAPKQTAPQKGPEILDETGQPVWFDPVPAQATDFRVQHYRGKPVLTFWEGPPTAPVLGTGVGHYVILDTSYRQVATVEAGFGAETADLHEFQLTPRGTALITAYRVVPVGGKQVADSIVQEVDVASGRVLFTWHSVGHVALAESYSAAPTDDTPFDYFHVNSVDEEPDGNLLVSARNTHAVYEIDRSTGAVLWRLGGKRSSFRMGKGTTFAWQHDARRQPDGTITIFDDGASPAVEKESRAIRIRLDAKAHTATLVSAYAAGSLAGSQGNVQVLANGDTFVGWGAVPRLTEFSPSGAIVFDATFSKGDDSYRAYRFAWHATPTGRPSVAVDSGEGETATLYTSWNGATDVARWQVLGGTVADKLAAVGPPLLKSGFETTLRATTDDPYLAVEALDADGRVLGRSAAVARGGNAIG